MSELIPYDIVNLSSGTAVLLDKTKTPVAGDLVLPINYPHRIWVFQPAPCPLPFWGCSSSCWKIVSVISKST